MKKNTSSTLALFAMVFVTTLAACGSGSSPDQNTNTRTTACLKATTGKADSNACAITDITTDTSTATVSNATTNTNTGTVTNTDTATTVSTTTTATVSSTATETTLVTVSGTVPSWCTATAPATKVGKITAIGGTFTAQCDNKADIWSVTVTARIDTPFVTATGNNTTHPGGAVSWTGTMGANCVYLEADITSVDKTAPTITGSKVTVTYDNAGKPASATVSGGNCIFTWNTGQ